MIIDSIMPVDHNRKKIFYLSFCFQIGFEKQWLNILAKYVVPMQIKVFPGYYSKVSCCTISSLPFSNNVCFLGKWSFKFCRQISSRRPT